MVEAKDATQHQGNQTKQQPWSMILQPVQGNHSGINIRLSTGLSVG